MARSPLPMPARGTWHRVTAHLIHVPSGGARIRVNTPAGQRTMPYPWGSNDPFLTAVLEAYGRPEEAYAEQLERAYRRRVFAIAPRQRGAYEADRMQRAIRGGQH